MNTNWIKSTLLAGGLLTLAAGTTFSIRGLLGILNGTIKVTNVSELVSALQTASHGNTILLTKIGSPYNLSEVPHMSDYGHLVVTKSVTLKGETGDRNDITLRGADNRILYIKSKGCKIEGIKFQGGNCVTNEYEAPSSSYHWGGAIYLGSATNECSITNCAFLYNQAVNGGAIAIMTTSDVSTVISDCEFSGNTATLNGGAILRGGIIENCKFYGNKAYKNGGSVYQGYVYKGEGGSNYAKLGAEMYDCFVQNYATLLESSESTGFHDCVIDRCLLTCSYGTLLSGYFEVRSSVIAWGYKFDVCREPATREVTECVSWEYNEQGKPIPIHYTTYQKNPSLRNCTIAENEGYGLVKRKSNPSTKIDIYNCLFYSNSIPYMGKKTYVNRTFVDKGYNKTVQITKAERYIALGWTGGINTEAEAGTAVEEEISIEVDKLDTPYKTVTIGYSNKNESVSTTANLTYRKYYHARGWNGNEGTNSFTAKRVTWSVNALNSNSMLSRLEANYTTNLTWRAYYTSLGWDGTSPYIESAEYIPYDIGYESQGMINVISKSFVKIDPSYSIDFVSSQFQVYPGGEEGSFSPKFLLGNDWWKYYKIDLTSDAYHENSKKPPFGIDTSDAVEWWMFSAKDMGGRPRLSGGGLDIGAYQASSIYFTMILIK